jgi:hypothetical protein
MCSKKPDTCDESSNDEFGGELTTLYRIVERKYLRKQKELQNQVDAEDALDNGLEPPKSQASKPGKEYNTYTEDAEEDFYVANTKSNSAATQGQKKYNTYTDDK